MTVKKILSALIAMSLTLSACPIIHAENAYDIKIEAESTKNTNFLSTTGSIFRNKSIYSSGKYLDLSYPSDGEKEWYAEYKFEVKEEGVYKLDLGCSPPATLSWASPIQISVNGGEKQSVVAYQFASVPNDWNIFHYHSNSVYLKEGSNTLKVSVTEPRSDGIVLLYFDWFGFKKGKYELTEITSDAPMQAFQQGEELGFKINGTGNAHKDIPVTYEVLDYNSIRGLRLEARQKLTDIKPLTVGQASRISGVSPADIYVLLIYLEKNMRSSRTGTE